MAAPSGCCSAWSPTGALAPSSKPATADWITNDVHLDGLAEVGEQTCYRALDWLHEVKGDLEKQVFDEIANLLNLEVDLLFFNTHQHLLLTRGTR